jgi:hypothetical protein
VQCDTDPLLASFSSAVFEDTVASPPPDTLAESARRWMESLPRQALPRQALSRAGWFSWDDEIARQTFLPEQSLRTWRARDQARFTTMGVEEGNRLVRDTERRQVSRSRSELVPAARILAAWGRQ